jgi:VWFA-related protein
MKRSWLVLLSVFVLAVPLATAQVAERVNVSLIEVPVTVADGSGNAVRGLKAENFVLSDDRGTHPIASFDVVDFSAGARTVVPPPARRSFLLLFDLSNTQPNSMARARSAAEDFVKNAVHPSDLAAVGTVSVESGFRMVTAFTSDRALLASAIADPANFIVKDPLGLASGSAISPSELTGVLAPAQDTSICFW